MLPLRPISRIHIKTVFYALSIVLLVLAIPAFAKTNPKDKIKMSFISEDASLNPLSFDMKGAISRKNEKNFFSFNNDKVTWSAGIKDGLGKHNKEDYKICWYAPDGSLFKSQTAQFIFMDCSLLKTSLPIDKNTMADKMGLWKVEVIYESQLIDEKYFYIDEIKHNSLSQQDIDKLESIISRDIQVARSKKGAEDIWSKETAEEIIADKIDEEKAKKLVKSYFETSKEDMEPVTDEEGLTHIAYGSKKIYWKGEFPPFFGVGSPKVSLYWISPYGKVFEKNVTDFVPTNSVSFKLKENIPESMLGEWIVIAYLNKSKIAEEHFMLQKEEKLTELNKRQLFTIDKVQPEGDIKEEKEGTVVIEPTADSGDIYIVLNKEIVGKREKGAVSRFWEDPTWSLDRLEIQGDKNSSKKIAILVFNTEGNVDYERLNRKGVQISKLQTRDSIADTYGYVIRFDLRSKAYQTNFLLQIMDTFNIKHFSSEKKASKVGWGQSRMLWRDISYLISKTVSVYFTNKDYAVLDLTPARRNLSEMNAQEILDKVSTIYNIDKIIIIPYRAYTKYVFTDTDFVPMYGGGRMASTRSTANIGLYIDYRTYIYNIHKKTPEFKYKHKLYAIIPKAANIIASKISFYSTEKDKKGEVIALKDGIIDDEWIVEKTLRKFSGYKKGVTNKVDIGGDLFEKLAKNGY